MKHLILLVTLALLACSTATEPTLEPNSYNPHRISVPDIGVLEPDVGAAANGNGHVCMTFGFGFCMTCMGNKARRDSVCAPYPGWQNYNPVPTMWGQPGSNQR
jgi:hypothetical protein